MKHTRKIGLFSLLAGASILPSVLVEDAALSGEAAIKGQSVYGSTDREDGFYAYGVGRRRSPTVTSNGLVVEIRVNRESIDGGGYGDVYGAYGFVDLNDLTVNQALPEAPVVQLNLSESPTSGKTLVRWNID